MHDAVIDVAVRFAAALDTEDYAALRDLLAPDCEYEGARETFAGPQAIIASYRAAGAWAGANLDSVRYESAVRVDSDGLAIVTFVDRLEHAGTRHVYSCEQLLRVDAERKIQWIAHRDLPGQREAVDAFLRGVGVTRGSARAGEPDG